MNGHSGFGLVTGVALLAAGLAAPTAVRAQVPEHFRLDVGLAWLVPFAPQQNPQQALALRPRVNVLDLAATLNIGPRVSISAGTPLVVVTKTGGGTGSLSAYLAEDFEAGLGDTRGEMRFQMLSERRLVPALSLRGEIGAPTATLPALKRQLWRRGAGATLSKSFGPRFSLSLDGSYSEPLEDRSGARLEPTRSLGLGLTVGVTQSSLMNVYVEETLGGRRLWRGPGAEPPFRDLHVSLAVTRYSSGRPRASLIASVVGLRSEPTLILGVRGALLSF